MGQANEMFDEINQNVIERAMNCPTEDKLN